MLMFQRKRMKEKIPPSETWLAEDEQKVCFGNEHCLSLSHTYAHITLLGSSLLIRVTKKS